ncbi:hypothetical protein GCM10027402_05050 [Arthrobacter monumenti]
MCHERLIIEPAAQVRKADSNRYPQCPLVHTIVVVNHEVAVSRRLAPDRFGETFRICSKKPLAQVSYPIAERFEGKPNRRIGVKSLPAPPREFG